MAGRESTNGATCPASPPHSRSAQVARKGIRTTRDAANLVSASLTDLFTEGISVKVAATTYGGVRTLIAVNKHQRKHSANGEPVTLADALDGEEEPVCDPIAERRKELLAELAELDEAKKLRS
jgi:hypothetical protein